jgi:hypothetical protein
MNSIEAAVDDLLKMVAVAVADLSSKNKGVPLTTEQILAICSEMMNRPIAVKSPRAPRAKSPPSKDAAKLAVPIDLNTVVGLAKKTVVDLKKIITAIGAEKLKSTAKKDDYITYILAQNNTVTEVDGVFIAVKNAAPLAASVVDAPPMEFKLKKDSDGHVSDGHVSGGADEEISA